MMDANEPPVAECFGLPVYVVDKVIRRDLGSGIASIINCRTINGLVVPQCEIVIAAHDLLPICRGASDFAADMQRRFQMEMLMQIGARH